MASEDLLKKAVAAFNALSPEQQAEMMEEQRQSWVRGNVGLSRDERGMTSAVVPRFGEVGPMLKEPYVYEPIPAPVSNSTLEMAQLILDMRDGKAPPLFPRVEGPHSVTIRYGIWEDDLFALAAAALQNNTRPAPAATDTGLVTVAWQHQDYDEWHETRVPEYHKNRGKNVRELVTRSQAEELLAAERAEKEQAKDDLSRLLVHFVREHFPENTTFNPLDDLIGLITQFDNASTIAREYASRIHVLEADNAALIHDLNRIKDHETELVNDNAEKDARIKELEADRDHQSKLSNKLNRSHAALEAKLAAAEQALEPFADIADLIDAETEGMAETDELVLHFHDYEFAKWPVSLFRKARAVLGGKP